MPKKLAAPFDPSKPLKNARHERFVIELARGASQVTAYREAYNREPDPGNASRLADHPQVRARINHLLTEMMKKAQASSDETLAEISRIARCDIGDLVWKAGELDAAGNVIGPDDPRVGDRKRLHEMPPEVRRMIKSIKVDPQTGAWEVTLWNKDHQLTNLAKHHKLIDDSAKMQVNVVVGIADKLRAAREKRIKEQKK